MAMQIEDATGEEPEFFSVKVLIQDDEVVKGGPRRLTDTLAGGVRE